jgi:hypothetical protein
MLTETINGLYKAELSQLRGLWDNRESVKLAALQWVHWFNHIQMLKPIEAYLLVWVRPRQTNESGLAVPAPQQRCQFKPTGLINTQGRSEYPTVEPKRRSRAIRHRQRCWGEHKLLGMRSLH